MFNMLCWVAGEQLLQQQKAAGPVHDLARLAADMARTSAAVAWPVTLCCLQF
jgi:hypothetical protein